MNYWSYLVLSVLDIKAIREITAPSFVDLMLVVALLKSETACQRYCCNLSGVRKSNEKKEKGKKLW